MIKYKDIFNENTLNIFTDASIRNYKNETIGSAGYIAIIDNRTVEQDTRILRDTTNSEAELYAIFMGIQCALRQRPRVKVINLFSDSQFAIYGLREWIFNWVNNIHSDKLYNSSRKEVAHQNIFMNIIYTILHYDLKISLYHNRGHFKETQVKNFIELFTRHNFLCDYIDKQAALTIIEYNNKVDIDTRKQLYISTNFPDKLDIPDYLARNDLDMNHYKELLNIN